MRHVFDCIDSHACGNPCRVVKTGAPQLVGASMADYRKDFLANHDWVRKALMFEPRGHDAMSGVLLYPPKRDDCDIGFVFIEVSGCLPMCGHDTIGAVTIVIEEGLVTPTIPGRLAVETPAGRIDVTYDFDGKNVSQVRFENVSSYLHAKDVDVEVAGLGRLKIDVAYGGNYYAIVEPQENWAGLENVTAAELVALSPALRDAAQAAVAPVHPEDSRIRDVSHVMWCDKPRHEEAHARNAVFYGDKAIDRSPCGTGTSARMAQMVAKGVLNVGDTFVHESFLGTLFHCEVLADAKVGSHPAIKPEIGGWAMITGHNSIIVDDRDPFAHGFQVL